MSTNSSRDNKADVAHVPNDLAADGFIRTHGPLLIKQGYSIVPIKPGTKRPNMRGWPTTDFNATNFSRRFRRFGVGVKTGEVVAVDVDVMDAVVVDQVADWCSEQLGGTLSRVGQPPKTLRVYRTNKPFSKSRSRSWCSPDGKQHQVEILGKGQQFVAYAVHPVTDEPYYWSDGDLTTTPVNELPELNEEHCFALFDQFDCLAEAAGWTPVAASAAPSRADMSGHKAAKDQWAPIWLLKAAMAAIPRTAADKYDSWIRIGAALHCSTGGSADGLQLWDEWSQQSDKYDGESDKKWKSFAAGGPVRAGAGTIFHIADQAEPGWRARAYEAQAAALAASRPNERYQIGHEVFDMTEMAEKLRRATGAVR